MKRRILVFTGSSAGDYASYVRAAHDTGQVVAERGDILVYGGGSPGCMGALATGCMSHGGTVIGIIPEFIFGKEQPMTGLQSPPHEFIVTKTMSERKCRMFALADAVVTLPGGYGSLDEFFEDLTDSKLAELHRGKVRPHVLVNLDGYWDPLITMINRIVERQFGPRLHNLFIVDRVEDIYPKLNEATDTSNVRHLRAAG